MPGLRALVISGEGRAFCAGLNLEAQSKGTDNLSVGSGATPTNIDLRNTPEFREGRITGSENVPYSQIADKAAELASK